MRRRPVFRYDRPRFSTQDLQALAEIPALALMALALPERRWRDACRWIESVKSRGTWAEPRRVAATAAGALGLAAPAFDARRFAVDYAANRIEQFTQGLREVLPGGWRATIVLDGERRLADARAGGRGAIAWVAPFAFASLAAKRAIAQAGHPISHVSRPGHGYSTSRFGVAVLNPLRVAAENRWLAERMVISDGHAGNVMMRAQRALRDNRVVSITAGGWEGQRIATVRLFGQPMDIAVGAPGLARLTGAPLLPVFAVRDESGDTIRVVVDEPIPVAADGQRDIVLQAAAQAYASRVEPWIRRHPDQWREWNSLGRSGPGATAAT